jgi:hypothetical protein
VEDLDPLKQLQSLIDDRGKVLEKISSIQSTLNAIKSAGSAAGDTGQPTRADPAGETEPFPGAEKRSYDSLFKMLRDMQAQIEERVRPLALETFRTEEARLRERYGLERQALEECLARVDQCLLNCRERIEEYEKRRAELARLSRRLVALGADPVPVPESLAGQDIAAVITSRFGDVRKQG